MDSEVDTLPYYIIPYYILSYDIIPYYIVPYYVIQYYTILYKMILSYFVWKSLGTGLGLQGLAALVGAPDQGPGDRGRHGHGRPGPVYRGALIGTLRDANWDLKWNIMVRGPRVLTYLYHTIIYRRYTKRSGLWTRDTEQQEYGRNVVGIHGPR